MMYSWGPSTKLHSSQFLPFIIMMHHHLLPLKSMAAPRIDFFVILHIDLGVPMILFTKFHVSASIALAPPMGQSSRCAYVCFSKLRYHCIPWIEPSSTNPNYFHHIGFDTK